MRDGVIGEYSFFFFVLLPLSCLRTSGKEFVCGFLGAYGALNDLSYQAHMKYLETPTRWNYLAARHSFV